MLVSWPFPPFMGDSNGGKEFIAHKRISVPDPGPCMTRYLALKGTNWIEREKAKPQHLFLFLRRVKILTKCA